MYEENIITCGPFTTFSQETKAAIVERVVRIYRYLTENITKRHGALSSFVESYNNTWHSGLGARPSHVHSL